jgi:hypothetical protein
MDLLVRISGLTVAMLAVLHSLATTQAAPVLIRQRAIGENTTALTELFDRFERWQAIRAALQAINFAALLWLLVELVRRGA